MQATANIPPHNSAEFFAQARVNMLECQLQPNKILDEKLLAAFARIPREEFVQPPFKSFAYSDECVQMSAGRKLLAPMILARMIQELRITPSDRVLDIGAGSGYAAAILNDIAGETVALETDQTLFRTLQQNKQQMDLIQISAISGPLCDGFAPASPFQAILIEGGVQWVPQKIISQLAEGGRIACILYPEGDIFGRLGDLVVWQKQDGQLIKNMVMDAAAALLPSFEAIKKFEF